MKKQVSERQVKQVLNWMSSKVGAECYGVEYTINEGNILVLSAHDGCITHEAMGWVRDNRRRIENLQLIG